jgi:hypothetical protein
MSKRKTKEEFIRDAIKKHGNVYCYDNVNYVNAHTLVDIICPKHGLFHLSPHDHLKGQGCRQCGIERRSVKRRLTQSDFIFKANKMHNGKYNYGLVEYVDYKTEVKIVCPIHGVFSEKPQNHLQGCGCKECANEHNSRLFSDTREDFITKARKLYGDKYDYSLVDYKGSKIDVDIICPIHGVFRQQPNNHLCGSECPKCSNGSSLPENEIVEMLKNGYKEKNKMQNQEDYIKKCNLIHNNKYNYENVKITRMKDKITIVCPIHGEFVQRADAHLKGQGCPSCKGEKISNAKSDTLESFTTKANNIHQNKYDYSKAIYINSKTPICITCKTHGEFWQIPSNHTHKTHPRGCPKCNGGLKLTLSEFIQKSQKVHGAKYDYSMVDYNGSKTKVCIVCPQHGEFWQEPRAHIKGNGCPICGVELVKTKNTCTTDDFILKGNTAHNNKYDYTNSVYVNNETKVCIICPNHGEFWQTPSNHLRGEGCPKCANCISHSENEICSCLKDIKIDQRNRKILGGKEIDIYIPQHKIGIEYNGLFWHSEENGKNENYHLNKLNECNKKGIELIQIFEDEWINKRAICESILKNTLGLNTNNLVVANDCKIREYSDKQLIKEFLEENNINGHSEFDMAIAAYYNSTIIGALTFSKCGDKTHRINHIATNINYNCVGIEKAMFDYFKTHFDFTIITLFADRRWTININDNVYTSIGFYVDSIIPPTFTYYNPYITKKKRIGKGETIENIKYTRIWDCGQVKYVYINPLVE